MSEVDALKTSKFPASEGLFVRLSSDTSPRKLRILTRDPLVSKDKWGNTRFGFVVYDYTAEKGRILNSTPGLAKEIAKLHNNEDWGGDIRKIDVHIETEGAGLETRHSLTPLPKTTELTNEQIKQCAAIKLEEKIENGDRMSVYDPKDFETTMSQEEVENVEGSGLEKARNMAKKIKDDNAEEETTDEPVIEDIGDEPINLDDIPF